VLKVGTGKGLGVEKEGTRALPSSERKEKYCNLEAGEGTTYNSEPTNKGGIL